MADKGTVELGYAVGTGVRVDIPVRHMVVTGQTQEAGKTTTLEALIDRAALPAIAFVTKRGERSFGEGRRMQPYFRERADWQFVSSVLEATMRERMKFERSWIMRVTKGAQTLAQVQRNVKEAMKSARSGIDESMYMQLDAYLDIIVPRLARVTFAKTVDARKGLNVVDVADRDDFPPELQGLVMRSVLEWVYEHANGTITIIPEAWEFVPQGRGSPVKLAAIELIRKGAGLKNYVWLDTQDIGGVDKELLRSCPVWLLGVQREMNEIKRVLDAIPAGVKKPKPADVALLGKGQFFACFGETVVRTYVRPKWMTSAEARDVARGTAEPLPKPTVLETGVAVRDLKSKPLRPAAWMKDVALPAGEDDTPSLLRKRDAPDFTPAKPAVSAAELEALERAHAVELEAARSDAHEEGRRLGFQQGYAAASATLTGCVSGVMRAADEFLGELKSVSRLTSNFTTAIEVVTTVLEKGLEEQLPLPPGEVRIAPPIAPRPRLKLPHVEDEDDGPWLRTLVIMADRHPMQLTRSDVATLAGMAPRGGGFLRHLRELTNRLLIIERDGLLAVTPEGLKLAGAVPAAAPKSTMEMVGMWEKKLPGGKGGAALRLLVATYPAPVALEQLADQLGMSGRGGGFLKLVRHMRRNKLIENHDGGVRASAAFFP